MDTRWLLLQLADAAFPAGGFAHSAGLEATMAFGARAAEVDVARYLGDLLCQTERGALPFTRAAAAEPARLRELDALADATILSHVGNRASRAQGRALASAASRIFGETVGVARVVDDARGSAAHHAPVFGAIYGALGLSADDAAAAFLHGAVRGVLSAAVRLGAAGPLEAQRLQHDAAPLLAELFERRTPLDGVAQTSPLLEIYGALHDRLDARLFQS